MFRLDEEVAFCQYRRLQALRSGWPIFVHFIDTHCSVECCENHIYALPLLPVGHCTVPFMGFCR